VKDSEAIELIRGAIPGPGGTWADFGAGNGVFTRALAERLDPGGRIYAVDRDARALEALRRWARGAAVEVSTVVADFTKPFELPGIGKAGLDGILMANALHFVRDPEETLPRLAAWLRVGGRLVLVEYDRRRASRWVPYPVEPARWAELAALAGLSAPILTSTRPSAFGGNLYVATAERTIALEPS
jgi:SAM-dependent methyltransferase